MKTINKLITFCILLVISGCASVGNEIDKTNKTLFNKPVIEYTAEEVLVSYANYKLAPVRAGTRVTLGSNVHGANASSGMFKLERARGSRYPVLVARIPMPSAVPKEPEDACFFVQANTSRGQKLLPADSMQSGQGFVNKLWQDKYAAPTQADALIATNKQIISDIDLLMHNNKRAKAYVASNKYIENGQCLLPPRTGEEPKQPFPDIFMSHKDQMMHLACMGANIPSIKLGARLKLANEHATQTLKSASTDTIKQYKAIIETNTSVTNLVETADNYYRKALSSKMCTARSSTCGILSQLKYGTPYRNFAVVMDNCVQVLDEQASMKISSYQKWHKQWVNKPIEQQQHCKQQLYIVNNYQDLWKAKNTQVQSNSKKIQALLDKAKRVPKRVYLPTYAGSTACNIR